MIKNLLTEKGKVTKGIELFIIWLCQSRYTERLLEDNHCSQEFSFPTIKIFLLIKSK